MPDLIQMDLFGQPAPKGAAWLDARLPRKDYVSLPDVAAAWDVCANTVRAWVDSGVFDQYAETDVPVVLDKRAGDIPRQFIARQAVLRLYVDRKC